MCYFTRCLAPCGERRHGERQRTQLPGRRIPKCSRKTCIYLNAKCRLLLAKLQQSDPHQVGIAASQWKHYLTDESRRIVFGAVSFRLLWLRRSTSLPGWTQVKQRIPVVDVSLCLHGNITSVGAHVPGRVLVLGMEGPTRFYNDLCLLALLLPHDCCRHGYPRRYLEHAADSQACRRESPTPGLST